MAISYAVGQRLTASLLQQLADYTVNRGICSLVQQSSQSLTSATETTVTFGTGSERFDPYGWHDETTNNTRITPTVAGWYIVRGTTYFASVASYTLLQCQPRLNGVNYATAQRDAMVAAGSAQVRAIGFIPTMVLMNGTTDYVEMMCVQSSAGTQSTYVNTSSASVFELEFSRPA